MNRRRFIINTGLGALGLYISPALVSCTNNNVINLNTILDQSYSILSSTNFLSKVGNETFGYYQFDEDNFTIENYKGKQSFIFYKNSKIIGFTLQIEGNDFFSQNEKYLSKSIGKYKTNFRNEFGEELQWNSLGKVIKLSVNNFKDLPQLTFYSEFLEGLNLVL
ncbi:hypothetical protein [Flavobacterium sp.]|uniref:hypothetical protein n=1 Tax=Flavobacterium sp. TaxID=239 RepID=UPI003D12DD42